MFEITETCRRRYTSEHAEHFYTTSGSHLSYIKRTSGATIGQNEFPDTFGTSKNALGGTRTSWLHGPAYCQLATCGPRIYSR